MPRGTYENALSLRDQRCADLREAGEPIVGKTVTSINVLPHDSACDSANVLLIEFTDGTILRVAGGYAGYSGHSCDEYVETLSVKMENP